MWTAIFTGIGEASTNFFKLLPPIGMMVDLMFIALGTFGTLYWIIYESRVSKGSDNYLSKK